MCVCMCVCVCVCSSPLQFTNMIERTIGHRCSIICSISSSLIHVCMCVCMHVCMCMYVCMNVILYVSIFVCMYACRHVCLYVYMHACIQVCTYEHSFTFLSGFMCIGVYWCADVRGTCVCLCCIHPCWAIIRNRNIFLQRNVKSNHIERHTPNMTYNICIYL